MINKRQEGAVDYELQQVSYCRNGEVGEKRQKTKTARYENETNQQTQLCLSFNTYSKFKLINKIIIIYVIEIFFFRDFTVI